MAFSAAGQTAIKGLRKRRRKQNEEAFWSIAAAGGFDQTQVCQLMTLTRSVAEYFRMQPMVDGYSSRAPSHDAKRHCRPGDMNWPAVRHGEFNDDRHEKQSERGEARSQAEHQQHRKQDFATSGKERHHSRRR